MVVFESHNRNKMVFRRKVLKGPKIYIAPAGYYNNNNKIAFILQALLCFRPYFLYLSGTLRSYSVIMESFLLSVYTSPRANPNPL